MTGGNVLANSIRAYLCLVLPLVLIAGIIEGHITPIIADYFWQGVA